MGESLTDALKREVREEAALDVVSVGSLAYAVLGPGVAWQSPPTLGAQKRIPDGSFRIRSA